MTPGKFDACSTTAEKEDYVLATINLQQVRQARENSRNLQQRRPELYGEIVKPLTVPREP